MKEKDIAILAVNALKKKYPEGLCSLNAENPLQLLIATRLSAQCTDARVNLVTPELFEKYKTVEDFAAADIGDIENIIHSIGFVLLMLLMVVISYNDIINLLKR